jgi:Domain of unknown function (DUF4190)
VTDPNLPEQPGSGVPPVPPASPSYSAPEPPAYGQPAAAYGQPAGYGQPVAGKTNTLAIVSLVASLIGLVSGVGFIVGIICGHLALSQIKKTGEEGRGLAIAGLIIGYVGILISIILTIVFIALFATLATDGILYSTNY